MVQAWEGALFIWYRLNPLIPEGDEHLISPFNITPESNIKVMRIKEIIIILGTSWLLNKFSLHAYEEMYREQYEEYAYWC